MNEKAPKLLEKATILFAGDSGDGIQLTGFQFSQNTALEGQDLSTYPDFPAEIRAPIGTVSGVSGFRINFGSQRIFTPGALVDALVAFNAAALTKNIDQLRNGGILIVDESGFSKRNLTLAHIPEDQNPLDDEALVNSYKLLRFDITQMTKEALVDVPGSPKDKTRSKNFFALGLIYWMYSRSLQQGEKLIAEKFKAGSVAFDANIKALRAGYHLGETIEETAVRFRMDAAHLAPGRYRSVMGNQAVALALIAASQKANLPLFYGSYPITPASDILHELSKQKHFGVKTFQAEDEIAAITSAIGAAYGGALAVTGSSGPGIALKGEGIGLAVILELPLVVINVQRGGPSTGLPTKTEQADLNQALYGRNGEAPLPVLAPASPTDCFDITYAAAKIAVEHMTPVMVLSDGFLANGSQPWKFPAASDLPLISPPVASEHTEDYQPYRRDENLVRKWGIPGTAGIEHRIGGLEKQDITGNISYDAENHQKMVNFRQQKIANIPVPDLAIEWGDPEGDVLVLGWGSTFGAIREAVINLRNDGVKVSQAHLRYIYPLPANFEELISGFTHILVPEMNMGQLLGYLRREISKPLTPLHKVKGVPFASLEIEEAIRQLLK
ncbi:MAG: 2-oxoacid:acceptor oxidoreductase subunit alpha [Cryomorphaceae bacterium]|nr:2-oxoacid:acceptor oxidoreductase subunit alpha [Cryomorphaceae bacterium]